MQGRARAPGAGTVLNALANGRGVAFGIDRELTATVELDHTADTITGTIAGAPDAETALIERCVALTVDRYGDDEGGTVRTDTGIPPAAGLKSSSAAANATVLATLDALGRTADVDRLTAARIGVQAARDVGVTVTGAFDDATASMLGGVTITDNRSDRLLDRAERDWDVLVWTPPAQAYSADAAVDRCRQLGPIADTIFQLAQDGQFGTAMTINGFAFSAALEFPTAPMFDALPAVRGVSLSGTGPSVVAIGDREILKDLKTTWEQRAGTTWLTTTQTTGAQTI